MKDALIDTVRLRRARPGMRLAGRSTGNHPRLDSPVDQAFRLMLLWSQAGPADNLDDLMARNQTSQGAASTPSSLHGAS